jgi:hypothetical protein
MVSYVSALYHGRMCFSATASFAATAVTGIAGGIAMRSARARSHRLLAAIPLLFAAHQLAEGVHWLALAGHAPPSWQAPAMYGFLIVGEAVWPFWVPLSILAFEDQAKRRTVLRVILALGAAVALARLLGMALWPVSARVVDLHIQYQLDQPPLLRLPSDIAYPIVVLLPLFVATNRMVRWLGAAVLLSLVVSKIFYYETFISVWCFFAALISALIVVILRGSRSASTATPHPLTHASRSEPAAY